MELGAVVVVPAREDLTAIHEDQPYVLAFNNDARPLNSARIPILGNYVLRSWMNLVRKVGLQHLWLTANPADDRVTGFALHAPALQEVEQLLLIQLKSYAEMDLADLLRFHREKQSPVTEAHDAQGHLGVCLIDHRGVHTTGEKCQLPSSTTDSRRTAYQFRGYAKRILSARERQELVRDGLTGACAMRPSGAQIREQVWIEEGADLAASVRIIGPTYIGARTIVRAGATIGPFASLERDCVVDCGTTVERSTVLPNTYLAPGLLVRNKLVDGRYLEDLTSGAVADLQPACLGGRFDQRRSYRQAFRAIANRIFSRADTTFSWNFAPSSTASQPWVEVPL